MPAITIEEYEKILPVVSIGNGDKKITFYVPTQMVMWRAETMYTKEPNTIEWLGKMPEGSVLVDIGANVGVFSLWAAKMRKARVFAFEPESQNFAILNRNIVLNKLNGIITAYCVALSDETKLSKLHLGRFEAGGSFHTADDECVDYALQPRPSSYTQGCMLYTLDRMVQEQAIPVPDFIKIDVDGLEHKVIAGMKHTLESGGVKSILLEANTKLAEHNDAIAFLEAAGFEHDAEYSARHRAPSGIFEGTGNIYFYRKEYEHLRVKDALMRAW